MDRTLAEIKSCNSCKTFLGHEPQPVINASQTSRIIIIGQAPGRKVHETGIPWNDPSGDLLRSWMAISKEDFYNTENIALMPMAFCYPGKGKSGDLPPRPECAPRWHARLIDQMTDRQATILIGQYSQRYYLGKYCCENLTETVRQFASYLPEYFPLPHPSPRNRLWLRKNPWFERDVLPVFRQLIQRILAG